MSFDLLSLIPSKFHSDILTTFVGIISDADTTSSAILSIREILDKIAYMERMVDPHRAPGDYLQYLADLIGAALARDDVATVTERRKELLRMIDWYKVKGTYQSIDIISLITGLTIEVYDKYFLKDYYNDYSTYVDKDWFVGNEGENPVGLSADYYKSPHFGISFLLDKIYPAGSGYDEGGLAKHLWRPSLFTGLSEYIEKTRPVNTVPHYQLLSQHITYEDGEVYVIEGSEVATQIVGAWAYSKVFFDANIEGSGEQVYFDEMDSKGLAVNYFDSSLETLIDSIVEWKLGTGGRDLTSSSVSYEVGPVVLSGSFTSVTTYTDRIEFKFSVDSDVVQGDINELGLYNGDSGDGLMVMSTFPAIHKGAGTRLDFLVIIYRD